MPVIECDHPDVKGFCRKCYSRQYYLDNKEKSNQNVRNWRKNNPEANKARRRSSHVKSRYGLTIDEAEAIWNSPCVICGAPPLSVIDHNHETGIVRGSVCVSCNLAIGILENRGKEWVQAMMEYIGWRHDESEE